MSKHRVTITDVANRAGVSKMTVSRVINQKGEISETTRLKILEAMEDLGYRPNRIARSLATNTSLRIGMIVPAVANPYFGEIIEGAESVFWENGYHLLLSHTNGKSDREQAAVEIFEDQRVDGIIVLSSHAESESISEWLQMHRAVVTINTHVQPEIAGRIYANEFQGTTLAIKQFIKNNRRHLGYVDFGISTYASTERYKAFELALQENGLSFDAAQQTRAYRYDGVKMADTIYEMLQTNPHIDGLMCFNSGIAARALQVCARLGRRVPEDIAIIGYDDNFMAELVMPPLTVLELEIPRREVGAMAAYMVLEQIENDGLKQEDVILKYKLVVRNSAP